MEERKTRDMYEGVLMADDRQQGWFYPSAFSLIPKIVCIADGAFCRMSNAGPTADPSKGQDIRRGLQGAYNIVSCAYDRTMNVYENEFQINIDLYRVYDYNLQRYNRRVGRMFSSSIFL